MGTIDKLIERHAKLDFSELVGQTLENTKDELIKYQQGQMLHGEAADGDKIGKYKYPAYALKKANMNPLAGYKNYDYRLTGEFQRNIKIFFFTRSFFFTSTDSKTGYLEGLARGGERLWGLNDKTRADYLELYFKSGILKLINRAI